MGRRGDERLVEIKDNEYHVFFKFDEEVNDLMREVKGHFDRGVGGWVVRHTPNSEKMMLRLSEEHGFEIA